ncbi:hypothetical protein [Collinsella tanakaei]|uniref:hypothetical protein n=1 Tax=Collinsella tanakaei TaxID=626935 RepID=UPI00265CD466|nr:hypothetical protein [Collinsella tanakaei]
MNVPTRRIAVALCAALAFGAIAPAAALANYPTATTRGSNDLPLDLKMSNGGKDFSGLGLKEDSTSTYVWANRIDMASCRLYVEAQVGPFFVNETVYGYATLRARGQWRIRQDVYEKHGQSKCRIAAWANNGGGVITGQWSADSTGSYVAINGD